MDERQESFNRNTGESGQRRSQNGRHSENGQKSTLQKIKDKCLPGVQITLLISLIFYIAMFAIGIWGVRKCPINDNIPFFLIVTGGIGLISKAITIIRAKLVIEYPVQYVESSFYTVETVFLLLGSFWVFKEFKPSFNPHEEAHYCNKTVYMFAFIYLAVLYVVIAATLLGFCWFLGCAYFIGRTLSDEDDPEARIGTGESQESALRN